MTETKAAEHVGDRVKRLREAAGYSQLALARESGISPSTLTRAEVGGVVTPATAERIASILGCDVEEILGPDRLGREAMRSGGRR